MIFVRAIACLVLVVSLEAAEGDDFFLEKVAPILEANCFECHSHKAGKMKGGLTLDSRSGWETGGEHGAAIVKGEPEKSLLIKAVRRGDPDLEMPPKKALSAGEVAILVEWVKRGAPDPREAVKAAKIDLDWWSLKKLTRPQVPKGESQNLLPSIPTKNPIDAFVEARLTKEGNAPSPRADRRTLIRRLKFDLHGLPPTVEEVEKFVSDPDPQAYGKLVDRLLNAESGRYGERWARHWLDAIHFADTHGFEHDLMRTNAWVYRDWVIEALRTDVKWGDFIRAQLAPDVFFADEPQWTKALGFLGAGPWDQSTAQTAPVTLDYLDRDDMVTQVMSTFASATVHCARCHDHKFDPISQEDYYGLQAVFAGVGKGDLFFDSDPVVARERKHWRKVLAGAEKGEDWLLENVTNRVLIAEWEKARGKEAKWETVQAEVFSTASGASLKRVEGTFVAEGARPETDVYTVSASLQGPISAVRLEVLSDAALPKNGPGRTDNGNLHLSEFWAEVFERGAEKGRRISIVRATADFNQEGWTISHAIDGNEKTAWGIFPRVGENHVAVFELKERVVLTNGARVVFVLKQAHGGGHVIGKFRLAVTGDEASRARALPWEVAEALGANTRSEAQKLAVAKFALKEIAEERLAKMRPEQVVFGAGPVFRAVAEGTFYKPWAEPKVVHLLKRGEIGKTERVAKPGAIGAIPVAFKLRDSSEGARRAALADWLADPENPLTWRSAVNRVWHHHFGRGIVDSLNDFGRMGSLPTHPELLDWLACEFRDSGGSLKALHKLIVTSEAYQRAGPEMRRRLDAESFRDAVLMVSGRLDLRMEGPGAQQFKLGKPIQITPTVDYDDFSWDKPGANRRSIYRFVYRGLQDPFMEALDFPDAAQLAPTRPFSASPLQSLALLNNDFVLFHCEALAKRLEAMDGDAVRNAFRLALQREPTEGEKEEFGKLAKKRGLAAVARVLFNSNEFLFVK